LIIPKDVTASDDDLTSVDALTSLYTYESGKYIIETTDFLNKNKDCQLVLIHFSGLSELVSEYGSTFAMAILENQADLIRHFFKKQQIEAISCRVSINSFAVFFTDISDKASESVIRSLFDRLINSFYGRSDDVDPGIRLGVFHFCDEPRDYREALVHAGAAITTIPDGHTGIATYRRGMESDMSYVPSVNNEMKLPAENMMDYDHDFISYAARTLSGSRDLDSNMDILLQQVGLRFDFDNVIICEFTGDNNGQMTNKWRRGSGIIFPLEENVNFEYWDNFLVGFDKRGFNIVLDVNKHKFSDSDRAFFKENSMQAFVDILLYDHNSPIGYFGCGRQEPLDELDSVTLNTLAHLSRLIAAFVTLRVQQNRQLHRIQALSIDHLTGMYTYAAFLRQVKHHLHNYTPNRAYAFISADISHFSSLNENFGYSEGDYVLRLFSRKIKGTHQERDIHQGHIVPCHLDADRFLLFMETDSRETMMSLIQSATKEFETVLAKRYPMTDLRVVSGVYFVTDPNRDLFYMIDSASHARKSIKHSYTESVAVYSDKLRTRRKQLLDVVGSVHDAIKDGYIEAFLQPKFSMVNRNIVGAEALVRWRNPDNTYRYPDQFVPILEDAGLIVDLDMCVFRQVLSALARWKADGKALIPVSVNFSRVHFRDEKFFEKVVALTREFNVQPKYIEIEVTESSFCENRDSLYEQLRCLREKGFFVDIDDFGTGYSSLNMLMSAPVDIVKVDKSFIDNYKTDKEQTYINQIGNLILSADKEIIFEGVETEDQIDMLTNYGYDYAQGYFFSKPIPLREFERKYIY
jgi:diguanylate cyclase (GGDEF)-like protein